MTWRDHPDWLSLVRGVCENPQDDVRRLAAADWLEETAETTGCESCEGDGHAKVLMTDGRLLVNKLPNTCGLCDHGRVSDGRREQAEFVRVQCELASDPDRLRCECASCNDPSGRQCVCGNRLRAQELFKSGHIHRAHGLPSRTMYSYRIAILDGYSVEVRSIADKARFQFRWSRGLIDSITVRPTDFQNYARTLFRQHPITRVKLFDIRPSTTDREPGFRNYFCWPALYHSQLWFLMQGGHLKCGLDSWRDTEEECLQDLSDALVAFGREEAGLQ